MGISHSRWGNIQTERFLFFIIALWEKQASWGVDGYDIAAEAWLDNLEFKDWFSKF